MPMRLGIHRIRLGRNGRQRSTSIDRCLGIVLAPVEPVVLDGIEMFETHAGRRAVDRTTAEVPFAAVHIIHHQLSARTLVQSCFVVVIEGSIELQLLFGPWQPSAKNSHGFTIGSDYQYDRFRPDTVINEPLSNDLVERERAVAP